MFPIEPPSPPLLPLGSGLHRPLETFHPSGIAPVNDRFAPAHPPRSRQEPAMVPGRRPYNAFAPQLARENGEGLWQLRPEAEMTAAECARGFRISSPVPPVWERGEPVEESGELEADEVRDDEAGAQIVKGS